MPQAFDGFSFDLFAYIRRHRPLSGKPQTQPSQEDANGNVEQDERFRRQQEDVAFWGLVAFPVL